MWLLFDRVVAVVDSWTCFILSCAMPAEIQVLREVRIGVHVRLTIEPRSEYSTSRAAGSNVCVSASRSSGPYISLDRTFRDTILRTKHFYLNKFGWYYCVSILAFLIRASCGEHRQAPQARLGRSRPR
jgi:hypothetical protein